ncbi:MAG: phage holin family protein [Balneolaceae bacterium]
MAEADKGSETDRNVHSSPGRELVTYIENRIELLSITIAEEIANVVSASVQKLLGLLFLGAGVIFLWIALGFFLGELLNSQALGFALAAIPLLIAGSILHNRSSKGLEQKIQADIIDKLALRLQNSNESASNNEPSRKEDSVVQK